jgi:hypothetical protein
MKHRFNNFVKFSIYILFICFAINVSAQEQCEWQTGNLSIYENCVKDLRSDYDIMVKDTTNNSSKHNMSRNDIYDTLLKQYEKLITHYDKKTYFNEEKIDNFTEKLESLKKTKN